MKYLNLPLGKWLNVPVVLHWSWVLLFILVLATGGLTLGLLYASLFFIVLLHELGHCYAGKQFGVKAESITLYPFGGAARMEIPINPKEELVVALAGPMVNCCLLLPFIYLASFDSFFEKLSHFNVMLIVFNMLPAFPMDGGRVLRALLAMFSGDHTRATLVAGRIGQLFCVLFLLSGFVVGNFMLPIIGIFIFMAAQNEIDVTREHQKIMELYRLVMGVDPPVVSPYDRQALSRIVSEMEQKICLTTT